MHSQANGVARKYFTLFVWDEQASAWCDEFGDYAKKDVKAEMKEHSARAKFKQVIEHDDSSVAMMVARDALEPPKGFVAHIPAKSYNNPWVNSFGGN